MQKCTAYEDAAGGKKNTEDANASLSGTWSYNLDLETIKGTVTIRFTDNDGSISGTSTSKTNEQYLPGKWKKMTEIKSLSGTREGASVTLTWAGNSFPLHFELKGRTLVGEDGQVWATRR